MNFYEYCVELKQRAAARRVARKRARAVLDERYRRMVRSGCCQFERDDIQVDDGAPVALSALGDNERGQGAWVQAWVWVPAREEVSE